MKNILITGGTGFVGARLARTLVAQGYDVAILRRHSSDLRAIGDAQVDHRLGDVRDYDSLLSAMNGVDTVFHTAAVISYWKKENSLMEAVNVGGTRNVVRACLESGVSRLIHTSSIAAIGYTTDDVMATEENIFTPSDHTTGYRTTKYLAEEEIKRGIAGGLSAVIVNPSVIIGPGDYKMIALRLISKIVNSRFFLYPPGGANFVFIDDVINGHLLAATRGKKGERYILGGDNMTFKEAFTKMIAIANVRTRLFPLAVKLMRPVASIMEQGATLVGVRPVITRDLVAGTERHRYFSSQKATTHLGYSTTPFETAVERTLQWMVNESLISIPRKQKSTTIFEREK